MEIFEKLASELIKLGLILLESHGTHITLTKGKITEVSIWGAFGSKYDCNLVTIRYLRGEDNDDWNADSVFRPVAYILDFPKDASWFFRKNLLPSATFQGEEPSHSGIYLASFELRCLESQIPEVAKHISAALGFLNEMWKNHAKNYLDHIKKVEKKIREIMSETP